MKNLEIEFKWEANTPRAFFKFVTALRSVGGVALGSPTKLRITDTYLDTPAGDLEKDLIALRVRNTDGKWEATYKTRTEIKNGKAVRREETFPLLTVKNLAQAQEVLAEKKDWDGIRLEKLGPTFSLKNKRTIYPVFYEGTEAELALDDCKIRVAGRCVLMKEIELECKRGSSEKLEQLVQLLAQKIPLKNARVSKVKTATELLKLWGNP